MMCQKNSNSTIINKSPMDFESRCQKVIPTYLRIRMGRRSSFTSRTWPSTASITPSDSTSLNLTTKRNSKISMENSWKTHCPFATRMNCDWTLKWHRCEHHMEDSTLDHNRMDQSGNILTINHCHHSKDRKLKHKIQDSTKISHSNNTQTTMMMIGDQKSQSHIKHKFSDLHRIHKRVHSTSKLHTIHIHLMRTVQYCIKCKNRKINIIFCLFG